MIDQHDTESIEMKSHLYTQTNGVWKMDENIAHRAMSNNSIIYYHKPSREQLHWQIERQRYSGEPGFINMEAAIKRNHNAKVVNPCVSGDTLILTTNGYIPIKDIADKNVTVWNGYEWSDVTPRKTGSNQTLYEITFSNGSKVKCTSYHKWLIEGKDDRVETRNLEEGFKLVKYYTTDKKEISSVEIISITELEGTHDVYCMNEPKNHTFIANGVITGNCAEVTMDSKGMCNLTTLNPYAFINKETGEVDFNDMYECERLLARAAYRLTCVRMELPKWDAVQKRDRLLGCSITGWQDFCNELNLDQEDKENILIKLHDVTREAADEYAGELGTSKSLCVTSEKPSGTISCLCGVSSGVHYSHSHYYIRRVRINSADPLVKVCEKLGYTINPENGETLENCRTKVVDFYCKAPEGKTKYDVSAIEQLEDYRTLMRTFCDMNSSQTVSVRDNEWDAVEQWLWDNWDDVVGLSFLSLDDSFYQLMPFESISEEEYNKYTSEMKPFIPELIRQFEKGDINDLELSESDCENGICPVR